jgi:prepilin-type N-terminal cleavage/methylation domain-containing protein
MERLHEQEGFGLVELLIAMTILAVGLMAMVAAFASASFGVNRGTRVQTATSIADAQIETFKMLIYDHVGVDISSGTLTALDTVYKNDTACYDSSTATYCTNTASGNSSYKKLIAPTGGTCTAGSTVAGINAWFYVDARSARPCDPSRTATGPDGRSYRVDTYVEYMAAGSGYGAVRKRKQVTVVVRDGSTNMELARETATIDCSTAGSTVSACP